MEPLYKEGDKVRVIKRKNGKYDYRFIFTDSMDALYRDKIVTISKVQLSDDLSVKYKCPDDFYCYYIKEDNGMYLWASSMFEPVSKNESEPLQLKIKTKQIKFNFNN